MFKQIKDSLVDFLTCPGRTDGLPEAVRMRASGKRMLFWIVPALVAVYGVLMGAAGGSWIQAVLKSLLLAAVFETLAYVYLAAELYPFVKGNYYVLEGVLEEINKPWRAKNGNESPNCRLLLKNSDGGYFTFNSGPGINRFSLPGMKIRVYTSAKPVLNSSGVLIVGSYYTAELVNAGEKLETETEKES